MGATVPSFFGSAIGAELRALAFRHTPTHYAQAEPTPYHRLVNFARRHAGREILDVGCATGGYSLALAERGFAVKATDVNPDYVRLACARGVDARLAGEELPFADRSFDTVLLFEVLEHVENHDRLLREVRRIARRNILITVPNCDRTDELRQRGVIYEHFGDLDHRHFFVQSTLRALLEPYFRAVSVRLGDPLNPFGLCHSRWLRAIAGVAWRLKIVRPRFHMRLYAVAEL